MTSVEDALRAGYVLHGFMSGGGLRVLRVGAGSKLAGYGEHPTVSGALRILGEDLRGGCRPYDSVYGVVEAHYLTGSSVSEDGLDAWLLRGQTWDVCYREGLFVSELFGWDREALPAEIERRAIDGETLEWTSHRGVTRVVGPVRFANDSRGCFSQVTHKPDGMTDVRTHMFRVTKTASAESLQGAIDGSLSAPPVEVSDDHIPFRGLA